MLIGEDSIDFDVTLAKVDPVENSLTLVVHHVPPKQPVVKLPAEWMRAPVADTPNNWMEVRKNHDGVIAGVGKETFDVEMRLSLVDGKILWGKLDNTVEQAYCECTDDSLASCGAPTRNQIKRLIEMRLRQ